MIIRSLFFLTVFLSLLNPRFLLGSDTIIRGGKMELVNKGAEVIFSSGVRMEQGADVVEANEMRTNKERDKVSARGNVRVSRKISSTETWNGVGDRGFYDTTAQNGFLVGEKKQAYLIKKDVISSTSTRIFELWADRIDFNSEMDFTKASGRVQGKMEDSEKGERYQFTSGLAEYDGKLKKVMLSGKDRPKVILWSGKDRREVKGRTITFFVDSNRMSTEGEAEAILENVKEEKN